MPSKKSSDTGIRKGGLEWSMQQHSEDEIRDMILSDPETICFTYVCRYSQMSEEFIENELIVLSTLLFSGHPEYYTKENIEFVRDIMFIEPTGDRLDIMKNRCRDRTINITPLFREHCLQWHLPIRSKVDWWQIACYQDNLSKDFRNKFASKFKEAKVRSDRPVENTYNEFNDL